MTIEEQYDMIQLIVAMWTVYLHHLSMQENNHMHSLSR